MYPTFTAFFVRFFDLARFLPDFFADLLDAFLGCFGAAFEALVGRRLDAEAHERFFGWCISYDELSGDVTVGEVVLVGPFVIAFHSSRQSALVYGLCFRAKECRLIANERRSSNIADEGTG